MSSTHKIFDQGLYLEYLMGLFELGLVWIGFRYNLNLLLFTNALYRVLLSCKLAILN